MEIVCGHCKTRLNITDEKIPRDRAVRVSCPKCKNKMDLDARKASPEEKPHPEPKGHSDTGKCRLRFIDPKPDREPEEDPYGYRDYSEDEVLGFYEEGTKLALVMDNNAEQSKDIQKAVEGLGYKFISAPNTRDAIGKMRFHHFDLVLLSDGFDGQSLENSPILNYLNHISMSIRRRIFVALMGERFKTMDNMMAFSMSANVVINTKESGKLSAILKRAISDNEKFYKVFLDSLAEVGKA